MYSTTIIVFQVEVFAYIAIDGVCGSAIVLSFPPNPNSGTLESEECLKWLEEFVWMALKIRGYFIGRGGRRVMVFTFKQNNAIACFRWLLLRWADFQLLCDAV